MREVRRRARRARSPMRPRRLDPQFERPRGIVGAIAGHLMARENAPSARVTVDLLDVRPHDRVLEIGFGPGVALGRLAARITRGRVAGVDASALMVAQAAERNRAAIRDGRVHLAHGSVSRLPFADGAFTRACAIHNIALWPDPPRDLHEVHRVLEPGGRLVITARLRDPSSRSPSRGLTEDGAHRVEAWLRAAGFRDVERHVYGLQPNGHPCALFAATRASRGA